MSVKRIDASGQPVDVPLGDFPYRNILVGVAEIQGDRCIAVAVRNLDGVTDKPATWQIYLNGFTISVNVLNPKQSVVDGDTVPPSEPFIGGDDPNDYGVQFVYGGLMFDLSNRLNRVDGRPIERHDPTVVEVLFHSANTMVDVALP